MEETGYHMLERGKIVVKFKKPEQAKNAIAWVK